MCYQSLAIFKWSPPSNKGHISGVTYMIKMKWHVASEQQKKKCTFRWNIWANYWIRIPKPEFLGHLGKEFPKFLHSDFQNKTSRLLVQQGTICRSNKVMAPQWFSHFFPQHLRVKLKCNMASLLGKNPELKVKLLGGDNTCKIPPSTQRSVNQGIKRSPMMCQGQLRMFQFFQTSDSLSFFWVGGICWGNLLAKNIGNALPMSSNHVKYVDSPMWIHSKMWKPQFLCLLLNSQKGTKTWLKKIESNIIRHHYKLDILGRFSPMTHDVFTPSSGMWNFTMLFVSAQIGKRPNSPM